MSAEFQGRDPLDVAADAERELNSYGAKQGLNNTSDSATESGVDQAVEARFPGAAVTYGSAASGQGGNREIPPREGGGTDPRTGQYTKARDFEGPGGPETKDRAYADAAPGNDDVRGNVRKGGERSYEAARNADRR